MSYYIAQFLGSLVTVGVIATLQIKNKVPMQIVSIAVNALSAANILLLNGFNSGVIVCSVAVFQLIVSIFHETKHTNVSLAEKIIFLILYAAGGLLGVKAPIDLLSVFAALFYMLAVFQKKEQRIRLMLLANLSTWTVYYAIIGSTAIFAQIAGIISSLIALYRYRNSNKS
jgi:hypothetical protein